MATASTAVVAVLHLHSVFVNGGVAPAFRLRELIPGWIIAITKMHTGDKWEVYIPAEQGYGRFCQPGIPGGSTLVFEIELIGFV